MNARAPGRAAPRLLPAAGWLLAGWILAGWLLAGSLLPPRAAAQSGPEAQGIVSLRATTQYYDSITPWIKTAEQNVLGSALVVEGRKLLTSADLVKNANLIEVRKFGHFPDYQARAVLVDYEANLALLEVEGPEFWEGLRTLPLASKPVRSGTFTINRWRPNGRFEQGTGEISDYQIGTSRFGTMEFPVLRGTTTVSGLGWAEVITSGGQVAGLLTSHDNQQIEATPAGVLSLFIQAGRRQPYPGFAHRGFAWQQLNQAALRRYFGLTDSKSGILVRRVHAGGTGAGQLKVGDILTKLGPYTIDPEGQIEHPLYGQMLFSMVINESLEETLPVELVRDGKPRTLRLRRSRYAPGDYRIFPYRFDGPIDYEVQGGLVVQEFSQGYLRAWGKSWPERAPPRLVIEAMLSSLRESGSPTEKVLLVTKVLPDPVNLGYDDLQNTILLKANGRPLSGLADFRAALKTPANGFQVLEFLPGQSRGKVVFKANTLESANQRIRERYDVPARPPLLQQAQAAP
jgi:S1-C subfamily serine protease